MSFLSTEHKSPNKKPVPMGIRSVFDYLFSWPPPSIIGVDFHSWLHWLPCEAYSFPHHLVLNCFFWGLAHPSLVPLVLTCRVMLMVVNELRDGAEKVLLSQVILALRCGTHNIMAYHPLRVPEEVDSKSATWEKGSCRTQEVKWDEFLSLRDKGNTRDTPLRSCWVGTPVFCPQGLGRVALTL